MKKIYSLLLCGAMLVGFSACEQNNEVNGSDANGHEYVDLDLPSGTLWATCNIGATTPERYGYYFAWGETERRTSYWDTNYKWYNYNSEDNIEITKYVPHAGSAEYSNSKVDGLNTLELIDDAAHVHWGGNWRTPTAEEYEELTLMCNFQWMTHNGVKGCMVTGPNGKFIFFPAAGWYIDELSQVSKGDVARYMSATLDSEYIDMCVTPYLCDGYNQLMEIVRYAGLPVRPVMSKE